MLLTFLKTVAELSYKFAVVHDSGKHAETLQNIHDVVSAAHKLVKDLHKDVTDAEDDDPNDSGLTIE